MRLFGGREATVEMVERALERLAAGTPEEKIAAARQLARSGDARATPALVRALGDGAVWDRAPSGVRPDYLPVARAAADALAELGPLAVPDVTGALASADEVSIPVPADDQGVYIGDYGAETLHVARLAADVLARIGAPAVSALPALVALLPDRRAEVRDAARSALLALAPHAGDLGIDEVDLAGALSASLALDDRLARAAWARKLSHLGGAAVPALLRATADPDAGVREAAIHALGRIGPAAADAVETLAALLSDASGAVRWIAAWALCQVGPSAAAVADRLADALADESARLAAAEALAGLGIHLDRARAAAEEVERSAPHQKERAARLLASLPPRSRG
jgi:HEAT repeat protein